MKTIRKGSSGPLVRSWQEFLRGHDLYLGVADGKFGDGTDAATRKFQELHRLTPDGVMGNKSWGRAMVDGFEMIEDTTKGSEGPNWPPVPKDVKAASLAVRQKLFGAFEFKPAPIAGNPEAIKILGSWTKENITRVTVPQLKGVRGAHAQGYVYWHKAAEAQLVALFQAWEKAGLSHLVLTWAGSWVPRFVRGSRTSLSNHAWGTAFDINVPWNGLRRTPALAGQKGSVRELVPLATQLGFYWGGWGWNTGRLDGMHFEVSRLLSESEIQAVLDSL